MDIMSNPRESLRKALRITRTRRIEIVENLVFLPLPTLGPWLEHWVGRYQGNLEKDRELPEGWMASQWLVKDGELPKGWTAIHKT